MVLLTTLLSNLDIDEVSLVGKAANGKKKFLIYKSQQERVRKMTPPASKKKATDIQKTVDDAVHKAMVAERSRHATETEAIRKELNTEKTKRRRGELAEIAKSQFGALGPIEETVNTLEAIEKSDMPRDEKKKLLVSLKQANEIKKQSDLFRSFGTGQPAPNTPEAAFEAAVQERQSVVQKSADGPTNPQVARAEAVAWVVKNKPELMAALSGGDR